MAGLGDVSRRLPVVFPVHPRTRKMMAEFGLAPRPGDRLILGEPLGYHASLCLTENARAVLTDSGGLQEEATYFRTPCLTLRPNTERPITITLGSNRLTSLERLIEDLEAVLAGPMRLGQVPPLWDGHTAERALDELIGASAR
jgi:UDP-N-acetylglucosamine 2-epimerase (non-hydrolysing)